MTNKQRDHIAGKVNAVCVLLHDVCQELVLEDKDVYFQSVDTWKEANRLLRAVSYINEEK